MSEPNNTPMPSLSDAIERLMANPELMSSIASAIGSVKAEPDAVAAEDTNSQPPQAPPPPQMPDLGRLVSTLSPMLSSLSANGSRQPSDQPEKHDRGTKKREALLCALKPYVSDGRKEAIDYIIRISQISDILKQVNTKGG